MEDVLLIAETFGSEHRPIVEFAVDNVQTLKLRKTKLQGQHKDAHHDLNNAQPNAESQVNDAPPNKKKSGKRKSRDENEPMENTESVRINDVENTVAGEEQRTVKKQKHNPASGKKKEVSSKERSEGSKRKLKGSNPKAKDHKDGLVQDHAVKEKTIANKAQKSRVAKKMEAVSKPKERMHEEQTEGQKGVNSLKKRERPKKKKETEVVDKLDMLIEQYRNKFSQQKPGENQGSKKLRRWYD